MTSQYEEIMEAIEYGTFLRMIDTIPSCIFFKDTNLRYIFSSHCWEQLNTEDIIGRTDLDIRKDKDNAVRAMEMDMEILKSKKGCRYTIKSDIDGHLQYLELIKEPVINSEGEILGIVGLINDITEKTMLEKKLHELSTVDQLTKLLNRSAGTAEIENCIRTDSSENCFAIIDIDKFKYVNDTYGHKTGDEVLKTFGTSIKECTGGDDIVMRLGGDEFIVVLKNVQSQEALDKFHKELSEKMNFNLKGVLPTTVTISMGTVKIIGENDFDSLYTSADKNMYEAKSQGGNCVIFK